MREVEENVKIPDPRRRFLRVRFLLLSILNRYINAYQGIPETNKWGNKYKLKYRYTIYNLAFFVFQKHTYSCI